ncbi:hypothetical protein PWT90_07208 [Aphanocladium album]|nr:hypothetical protein PWT90_07208 [Aphanocladium album]
MAPITLDSFAVTRNAFLPEEPPLACLPDAYYRPWETIAQNLPALIRHRELRTQVKQLPLLDTDRLATEPEWRRAYVALSYIAHAHIWGGETPEENQILPPQISIPLLAVSAHVELPPVLTCAAVNIWNYTLRDPSASPTDPDALSIPTTFTGTESEAWFQKIGTAIEAQGGSVIDALLSAFHAVQQSAGKSGSGSLEPVTAALVQLRTCLGDITRTLERMHERCDPLTFCHQIRPFYAGSKDLRAAGLPRGVFYSSDALSGGGGGGEWLQLPGGSNGQSALIQLFDVVLGLGFGAGCGRHDDYYFSTRACTPGPHRRFLAWAAHMGSIRALALREREEGRVGGAADADSKEQKRLRAAFVGAADALSAFRTKHIQIVTRYIAMPLKKSWQGSVQSRSLPLLLPSGLGDDGSKGTAGTTMLEFLKSLRNETANTARLAAD